MNHEQTSPHRNWLASGKGTVLCVLLAIIGFLLFTEHRAHVFGILPYLLLLACPFMHFFMHRGHGGHGGGKDRHLGHH